MFFDLDKLDINIKGHRFFASGMEFSYNGEDYYYKTHKSLDNIYNEILAKKIADRIGVPCCEYYLGTYNEGLGSVSKMFSKKNYQSMSSLLQSVYGLDQNRNNLEDINNIFDNYYSVESAERLKKELVNIQKLYLILNILILHLKCGQYLVTLLWLAQRKMKLI